MAKKKTDPRTMMELAIAVMRESVAEFRADDKPSPMVGAVLVRMDGTIDTAARGELRDGDHAEFALLERKNRHVALDGAVLYATLEPCAPGSRQHPKLGCAERIVLARIKEVYIGITDPDPTVDRKGMQYLLDHHVKVQMFDRDLQDIIRAENKSFIEQAEVRAAKAKEPKSKEVVLSTLEKPIDSIDQRDLSPQALAEYRGILKLNRRTPAEFNRTLVQQGILLDKAGRLSPSGFGALLFGRNPRAAMPQAGLLATLRYPNGEEETKDFDGPLVDIPEEVEAWLRSRLPNVLRRDRMKSTQRESIPFVLVREAVVNALVHRDYDIQGAKCQLFVDADTIVVRSPGKPIAPITLDQMQAFEAPMLSRNPLLHYVFRRFELAEERGLGLDSLKRKTEELGLPLPRFSWKDPYLELTLYRKADSAVMTLPKKVLNSLNPSEREGVEYLTNRKETTVSAYAEHLGLDIRQAQRHLKHLLDLGVVVAKGQTKNRRYMLR
jgi:ATP-dependent DNA helicase RecG